MASSERFASVAPGWQGGCVLDLEAVWDRIRQHSGEEFRTIGRLPFAYEATGSHLVVSRHIKEIIRALSRGNFQQALVLVPASGPCELQHLQGPSYTWAILMDPRIRCRDW